VALLTKFLADLPLHAQHRLDCIRLAIDKNMAAKNFGVAARLIQVLMPHNLPDSKEQAEKFKVCKTHKWSDHQLPPYQCAACSVKLSPATPECSQCGTPVKFCCISFRLLEGPVVVKCTACEAAFNKAQQAAGVRCPLCDTGVLEELDLEVLVRDIVQQKQALEAAKEEAAAAAAVAREEEEGTKPAKAPSPTVSPSAAKTPPTSAIAAAAATGSPIKSPLAAATTVADDGGGTTTPRKSGQFQLQAEGAADGDQDDGQQ
jgi:hypothetical protein